MTDLERARWLLPEGTDEVEVCALANALAAARREGAEAALEEAAQMCFRANPQSNPNAMGHAIRALKEKIDK